MASELEFFRRRADIEWANAAAATLANVRERSERAARSWEAMARRSEQFQRSRQAAEAARGEPSA